MPVSSLKCFHEKTDTTREYSNPAIFVRYENGRRRILSAQSINTERASLTLWWVWYLQYLLLKDVLYNVKDLFWLLVIAVLLKRISSSTRYRTGVENFQQNRCTLLHLSFVLHVSKFLRVSRFFGILGPDSNNRGFEHSVFMWYTKQPSLRRQHGWPSDQCVRVPSLQK